jgi:hypothetical protein
LYVKEGDMRQVYSELGSGQENSVTVEAWVRALPEEPYGMPALIHARVLSYQEVDEFGDRKLLVDTWGCYHSHNESQVIREAIRQFDALKVAHE